MTSAMPPSQKAAPPVAYATQANGSRFPSSIRRECQRNRSFALQAQGWDGPEIMPSPLKPAPPSGAGEAASAPRNITVEVVQESRLAFVDVPECHAKQGAAGT
jgi:hypothetical protein